MNLPTYTPQNTEHPKPKQSPSKLKIIIPVAVAILAIVVVVIMAFTQKSPEREYAEKLAPYMPEYTVDEIEAIGNEELTDEQYQVAMDIITSGSDPEIAEILEDNRDEDGTLTIRDTDGNVGVMQFTDPDGIAQMTDEEAEAYTQQILDDLRNPDYVPSADESTDDEFDYNTTPEPVPGPDYSQIDPSELPPGGYGPGTGRTETPAIEGATPGSGDYSDLTFSG